MSFIVAGKSEPKMSVADGRRKEARGLRKIG